MDPLRLAGIVIIAGFVIFWGGNLASPPGVYTEADIQTRLDIVLRHPIRWALSQGLGGVGIAAIAAGLAVLSIRLRADHGAWLTMLPLALNALSVILVSAYLYRYITDPASSWEAARAAPLLSGSALLMLAAGLLYGILFLQLGLPGWLGYLSAGYSIVGIIALLAFSPPTFYVISFYYFIVLAAGIVMVR